jgi:hypothetical protein
MCFLFEETYDVLLFCANVRQQPAYAKGWVLFCYSYTLNQNSKSVSYNELRSEFFARRAQNVRMLYLVGRVALSVRMRQLRIYRTGFD